MRFVSFAKIDAVQFLNIYAVWKYSIYGLSVYVHGWHMHTFKFMCHNETLKGP